MNDLEMLKSQLAEARTQANDWKVKFDRLEEHYANLGAKDTEAVSGMEAYRVALYQDLLKYGRHLESCSGQDKCDCGFYAIWHHAKEMVDGETQDTAES